MRAKVKHLRMQYSLNSARLRRRMGEVVAAGSGSFANAAVRESRANHAADRAKYDRGSPDSPLRFQRHARDAQSSHVAVRGAVDTVRTALVLAIRRATARRVCAFRAAARGFAPQVPVLPQNRLRMRGDGEARAAAMSYHQSPRGPTQQCKT